MSKKEDLEEYLILTERDESIQKKLNQWRHEYYIQILSFTPIDSTSSKMVLMRTKKLHD